MEPNMDLSFEERVRNTSLTRTGQKIAAYCLQNKSILAFQPLSVIASQLGISDISIVRFSRALGYEGFTDMKQHVHEELTDLIDGNPSEVNTLAKFTANMERQKHVKFENSDQAIETYSDMIAETLDRNDISVIEEIADCLITTQNHYIVGFFSRAGSAELMHKILLPMLSNLYTITGLDMGAISYLSNITANDAVVLFSFGRSIQYEKEIADAVHQAGAKLVVITDQTASEIASNANFTLYSKANVGQPFHSNVCNVMLAELISSFVATNNWAVSKEHLARLDMHIANLADIR